VRLLLSAGRSGGLGGRHGGGDGSVFDPRRFFVEKPTRFKMTFIFSSCQNCNIVLILLAANDDIYNNT